MNVGFIGLGTMGSRIAENLIKSGHEVRVWNRSRAPVDALTRLGARPVSTAREAFSGDAVFSMLADDNAVRTVIDGLLDDAPKGLVHVKTYGALIAKQQYEPAGFKLSLLLKDVRLALAAADAAGAPMPLADVVHESLLEASAHGDGDRDVAVLGAVAMRRAGAKDEPMKRAG